MTSRLLDITMNDGSRNFGEFPANGSWYKVCRHVRRLKGAKITDILTDYVTEAWLDFSYAGYDFTIHNTFGSYWFFVTQPSCPDDILIRVLDHYETLLGKE